MTFNCKGPIVSKKLVENISIKICAIKIKTILGWLTHPLVNWSGTPYGPTSV